MMMEICQTDQVVSTVSACMYEVYIRYSRHAHQRIGL